MTLPTMQGVTPADNRLLRLELLVFLLSIGIGCFVLRTVDQERALERAGSSRTGSFANLANVISNEQGKVSNVTNSINRLTKTLALSISQIRDFSGKLKTHQGEIGHFDNRLRGVETILRNRQQSNPAALEVVPVPEIHPRSVSEGASLSNPHIHSVDLSIPLPAGLAAHRNAQGEIDYWIVPRVGSSGEYSIRVQPYGASSLGVLVHDVDGGKDYVLTAQGGWTEIPTDK